MALEDILSAIRREAESAARRLQEDAESEAGTIIERAVEEAEREEARLAVAVDDRIRQGRGRILSRSHFEAAKERRAARETVYRTVLEEVSSRLAEVRSSPRYRDLLEALLDATLKELPSPASIQVDAEDARMIKDLLEARGLDASVETGDVPLGGLVAIAGGRSVDNTLTSRLQRADPQLRLLAGEVIPALRGGAA